MFPVRLAFPINAHQNANQKPIGSAPSYRVQRTLPPDPPFRFFEGLVPRLCKGCKLVFMQMCACFHIINTSQMIYHRGGEPERAMQLNVMAHKPWITAEFVTVWCSCRHERGKQYFVQPFLRSIKLLRLHTRFKRHTEVMS